MAGTRKSGSGDLMEALWQPSYWGKRYTKTTDWSLSLDRSRVTIFVDDTTFRCGVGAIGDLDIQPGLLWSTVELVHRDLHIRLRGIPNRQARDLAQTIVAAKSEHRRLLVGRPSAPPSLTPR